MTFYAIYTEDSYRTSNPQLMPIFDKSVLTPRLSALEFLKRFGFVFVSPVGFIEE